MSAASPLQRWVSWLPLWLGAGVALYFRMPFEPPLWIAAGLLLLPVLWCFSSGKPAVQRSLLAISAVYLGFICAIWQTERLNAPVLQSPLSGVEVQGRIREITIDGKRQRLTLDEVHIAGLAADKTPHRIRVSATLGNGEIGIGQHVSLRATLAAPSRPVLPGGFDFGRYFFFRGIGAIGYAIPPILVDTRLTPEERVSERLADWMGQQRLSLKRYFMTSLPMPSSALSVAYVTGDQSSINEEMQQSMRAAGLSHVLAISGMHMTIVCGLLYYLLRLALALIPALAMRYDIRKPAACVALVSGILYLWLADFPISAVRAYVMIAIFFSAILVGREADGLRSLVLAAVFILLVQPSSLLEPGFQLSFAAVLALIVYYRWWAMRRETDAWESASLLRRGLDYIFGIAMTSVVAGAATAPLAAYHFHQFASYGLLANMICVPLVSFIVTPALMLGLVLAPVGLEAPAMDVVTWGFNLMVNVAGWVAHLPGALLNVPPIPAEGLASMLFGALLMLRAGYMIRLVGAACLMMGLLTSLSYQPPDLLVSGDASAIALRQEDRWQLLKGSQRNFSVREWQRAMDTVMLPAETPACDYAGCVVSVAGRLLALPRFPRALALDCQRADLIVTEMNIRGRCPSRYFDGPSLRRLGTHALWLGGDRLRVEHGCTGESARPWNRCKPH
jgi:competence protein ComEC